jgi:hypothetical protein
VPRVDIDKPVRLGRAFWCVYAVLLGPALWILKPWGKGLPLSSEIIGAILFPFLAAIALYTSSLFLFALVTDFQRQSKAFGVFFAVVFAQVVALLVVNYYPGVAKGVSGKPVAVAFLGCLLANGLVYFLLRRKALASNPASALVKPAEEHESGPD